MPAQLQSRSKRLLSQRPPSQRLPSQRLKRKKDAMMKTTRVMKREKVKDRAPLGGTCEPTEALPEDQSENNFNIHI